MSVEQEVPRCAVAITIVLVVFGVGCSLSVWRDAQYYKVVGA